MRTMLKGHSGSVYNVAFSPNGRSLVSSSFDTSVRIWNIRDGSSKVLPRTGTRHYFMSVVFSPDGRYIAAGNHNTTLWIWDSRTHRLLAKWWGHTSCVWSTVFTPDGKGLISGAEDKVIKCWDVSSLGSRRVSTATVVDERHDGFPEVRRFLALGVRFVLLLSGKHWLETFITQGPVYSIALFPDNCQWIVIGSNSSSVQLWDTRTGVCQLSLRAPDDFFRGVDVSRTQNFLATSCRDGHTAVWKYKWL